MHICNLEVETVKKDIKNIHLAVYPPKGKIRIATPLNTDDETIKLFLLSKIPWIRRQKNKFNAQKRQSKRDYVTGESHYFLGQRYLLDVQKGNKDSVEIKRKKIICLTIKKELSTEEKQRIIENYYRKELTKIAQGLITKWQSKTKLKVDELRIKKMKTKWGTCNPEENRIWLNLELVKAPIQCIEYVLVHEMMHLIEEKHSEKFFQLLENNLPNWKNLKQELNNVPLIY